MNSLRQLGGGLLYAVVSVVLVVGGLSLALAEGGLQPASPPPSAQPSSTVFAPSATTTEASPTQAVATAVPASATSGVAASSTPQIVYITATGPAPTATTYVVPRATATYRAYATTVPCGPFAGWLLSYIVQPGDTLFHISTLYRTNVLALQRANCKTTTFIFPGERLWVPNVPTITPGVTLPPSYATATAVPTEPLTLTPLPFTATVETVVTDPPN